MPLVFPMNLMLFDKRSFTYSLGWCGGSILQPTEQGDGAIPRFAKKSPQAWAVTIADHGLGVLSSPVRLICPGRKIEWYLVQEIQP